MEPLENILRPDRNSSAPVETPQEPVQQETTQAPVAETPPEQTDNDEDSVTLSQEGRKFVPQEALHAERQKSKKYTEQIADFERKLGETDKAWERRFNQLLETVKPKEQPKEKPDWFEDPDGRTMHLVSPIVEQMNNRFMAQAKELAEQRFTAEKVDEAEKAFGQAYQSGALDPAEFQKVVNSPNIYRAAYEWHQRQRVLTDMGGDPVAWEARKEAEIREKLLAELIQGNGTQSKTNGLTTSSMPSNFAAARNVGQRGGLPWSGPKSIAEIQAERREVFKR